MLLARTPRAGFVLVLVIAGWLGSRAQAQYNYVLTAPPPGYGAEWAYPNWAGGLANGHPTATDNATIAISATCYCDGTQACNNLTINNSGALLYVWDYPPGVTSGYGSLRVNGSLNLAAGSLTWNGTGLPNSLLGGSSVTAAGTTLSVGTSLVINTSLSVSGSLAVTGAISFNAGAALVLGSTAVVSGTGIISSSGATISYSNLQSGNVTFSPGTGGSTGTLRFGTLPLGGLAVSITGGGSSHTQLFAGTATPTYLYQNAIQLHSDGTLVNGQPYQWSVLHTSNLLTGVSASTFDVTTDFPTLGTPIVTVGPNDVFVTFTPVPEPRTVLLIAAVMLLAVGRRRV